MRQKRCRNPDCLKPFQPDRPMQVVCSPGCAHPYVKHREKLKFKAETRKRKRELNQNDRKWWLKQAEKACNAYIRKRDHGQPCISCGKHKGRYDAGHYRPAGNNSFLRFHQDNIHSQCHYDCNIMQSGNLVEYRINLVKKIGADRVAWLEGHHPTKKWTIDELREVVEHYRNKIKSLEHDAVM